ncbi:hypothetical protein EON66_06825, partial [archaeon]
MRRGVAQYLTVLLLTASLTYAQQTDTHVGHDDVHALYSLHMLAGNGTGARDSTAYGVGTSIAVNMPCGVTMHVPSGAIYFVEYNGHVARVITPDGNMRVVAGDSEPRYTGDNIPANTSSLRYPTGVEVDASGTRLWIADAVNYRVREVNLVTGIISTVAGNGSWGPVQTDGSLATAAAFGTPYSVAANRAGDKLWVVDIKWHRVRLLNLSSGIITTVAGIGIGDGGAAKVATLLVVRTVSAVTNPSTGGVVLYMADTSNHRIRRVDEAGIIT